MMYEMKNLYSPSEQGERTDKAFLTVAASIASKRWAGPIPAVTWEGVGDKLRSDWVPRSPSSTRSLGPKRTWLKETWQVTWGGPMGTGSAWFCLQVMTTPRGSLGFEALPYGFSPRALWLSWHHRLVITSLAWKTNTYLRIHILRSGPGAVEDKRNVKYKYIDVKTQPLPSNSL